VKVAITTRYARAAEMTTPDAIEVREMELALAITLAGSYVAVTPRLGRTSA
jgi:hypothetical protein